MFTGDLKFPPASANRLLRASACDKNSFTGEHKMNNQTGHLYTLEEVREALRRLIRLGMQQDHAVQVVTRAFPEFRHELLH